MLENKKTLITLKGKYQKKIMIFEDFVYRYRFLIALALFCVCVIFEITGSSIGLWCQYFGESDFGILLGKSRPIRSDEWAVFSPLGVSQYFNDFGYFSNIPRAAATDMFLEYGQAVKNPLVIFRPFFWGFLFLPVAKGMAWFWCGRLIALFLVSFEFGMLLTEKSKKLSLAFSFLVAYAPVVQWWFAINGLVEMLVFTMLSIILFRKYLKETELWKRLSELVLIALCAGGYAFTFYPSWMIPLAYVLLGLIIWTFFENYKNCKMSIADWAGIFAVVVLFGIAMIYFYSQSKDAIALLRNTVYPGSRFETGSGMIYRLFLSVTNIWHALTGEGAVANVCESSYFMDFFPLCWILPLYCLLKQKKRDFLLATLFCVSLFLGVYCVFGFPPFLAKITLLSNSQSVRCLVMFGFCNLLMLFRSISILDSPVLKNGKALLSAFFITLIALFACYRLNPNYLSVKKTVFTFGVFLALNYFLLHFDGAAKKLWCLLSVIAVLFGSFLANPIRSGIKSVENLEIIKTIREISESDKTAAWLVNGNGFPIPNVMLLAGVPCINSTNIYPNLERWKLIDENAEYKDNYNRYAHINVNIMDIERAEFSNPYSADGFNVALSISDARKIGAKYIMSSADLFLFVLKGDLTFLRETSGYKFYKINETTQKMSEYVAAPQDIDYKIVSSEISYHIDHESISETESLVRGWAYHGNDECSVFIESNGRYYPAYMERRPDVKAAFSLATDTQGFAALVPEKLGEYKLVLLNHAKKEMYRATIHE